MSDPMIEDLSADLVALLERERLAYPEDASMRAAVLAGVEAAVGAPGGGADGGSDGGDAGGAPPGGVGSAALRSFGMRAVVAIATGAFVAGGVVGGVVVNRASAPAQPSASVAVSSTAFAVLAPAATSPVAGEARPIALLPSVSAPLPPTPSAKDVVDSRGDLTRERELLDAARASLSRSNPTDAIAAAERHAQRWPRGYLVEEREAVWIQALAAAGRRAEAERKASLFRGSFPGSVLAPAVDAALKRDEKPSTP